MYRPQLIHCLKLAFFPVIACILLAGHASGQTPTRIMPLGDSITGSPRYIQSGQRVEFGFQATKNGNAPHAINISGNVCE